MKATELRMGDWVLVDGEPMKIAETDLTYFAAWKKDGTFCGKIGYEAAEPIALTEEELEANGWKEDDEIWDMPYTYGYLSIGFFPRGKETVAMVLVAGDGLGGDTNTLREIKYIHELQHLLWALGVEKEVEV